MHLRLKIALDSPQDMGCRDVIARYVVCYFFA